MVYEMPCPDDRFLFVASSLSDKRHAEREIDRWARTHGYRPHLEKQTFLTFQHDQPAQEWCLLERQAD